MKKTSAFLLAILMCLSCMLLVGCSSDKDDSKETLPTASIENVKQAVIDYYDGLPFENLWYYKKETDAVKNEDWVFDEVKELEENKFRVKGSFNEYECDANGRITNPYPDEKSFDKYVTFYPETGNYDVSVN